MKDETYKCVDLFFILKCKFSLTLVMMRTVYLASQEAR